MNIQEWSEELERHAKESFEKFLIWVGQAD